MFDPNPRRSGAAFDKLCVLASLVWLAMAFLALGAGQRSAPLCRWIHSDASGVECLITDSARIRQLEQLSDSLKATDDGADIIVQEV